MCLCALRLLQGSEDGQHRYCGPVQGPKQDCILQYLELLRPLTPRSSSVKSETQGYLTPNRVILPLKENKRATPIDGSGFQAQRVK